MLVVKRRVLHVAAVIFYLGAVKKSHKKELIFTVLDGQSDGQKITVLD